MLVLERAAPVWPVGTCAADVADVLDALAGDVRLLRARKRPAMATAATSTIATGTHVGSHQR